MSSSSARPQIKSYAEAAAFLAGGRNKTNRPHGNSRRIVANHMVEGSISMVYHRTPVVTYFPNGTTLVWFNRYMTKTTAEHIDTYTWMRGDWGYVDGVYVKHTPSLANLTITNRNRQGSGDGYALSVDVPSWPRTPSSIKRCRSCKGAGQRMYEWHGSEVRDCLNCDGEGMKEFGNGFIAQENDGSSPILLGGGQARIVEWSDYDITPALYDCACKLCQSGASTWQEYLANQTYYAKEGENVFASGPTPGAELGYADSGEALKALLPGLKSWTACPDAECTTTSSIELMIIHVNDKHHWTRHAIADWLDTLDADLSFPITH